MGNARCSMTDRFGSWLSAAIGCAAAVSLVACANDSGSLDPTNLAPPTRYETTVSSRTFTSAEDFAGGELIGLVASPEGHLQVNGDVALFQTPYIWIPNSKERTASQIDTRTMETIGTYPLIDDNGEECWNPSRTTVDLMGDVWLGCRGDDSYINREDIGARLIPQDVDNKVMKLSRHDGRVLLSIKVGNAPRALALDANNHLWVGCSVDDTVWEIDGNSGYCYRGEGCDHAEISIADFPYGAAVDQRGHLWIVQNKIPTNDADTITEISTETGAVYGEYGPYMRGGCDDLYGIAIDQLNNVWLGGFGCDDVVKVKGFSGTNPVDGVAYITGQMIAAYDMGGETTRGVAVDLDGNIWAASSGTNTVSKLNGISGAILDVINVGQSPIGVGVDAYGHAWVVNRGSDSVMRIVGLDAQTSETTTVGRGPYTYSDMLGISLRTITHRGEGISQWLSVIDSGVAAPAWTRADWEAVEPPGTKIRVRVRCAETTIDLQTAQWGAFLDDPGVVSCDPLRYLEVQAQFTTSTAVSPMLTSLRVEWDGSK